MTGFARIEHAANNSPVGKIALAAGFSVMNTGGGCVAWAKQNKRGDYVLLTFGDNELGIDLVYPHRAPWGVGIYDRDGSFFEDEVKGLEMAMAWCNAALDNPVAFLEMADTDLSVDRRLTGQPMPLTVVRVPNLFEQALRTDDVDAAIKPIMDALGITDGDIAGAMFSSHEWLMASIANRSKLLVAWVDAEITMALCCTDTDHAVKLLVHI